MAHPRRGRIESTVITWLQTTGGLVVRRHWCTSRGQWRSLLAGQSDVTTAVLLLHDCSSAAVTSSAWSGAC